MAQSDIFQEVSALRKAGRDDDAVERLHDALRWRQLDSEGIDRAGRLIRKHFQNGHAEPRPLRMLLLGQFTTSWLATALAAEAWRHRAATVVVEGDYDNILQDLDRVQGGEKFDVVVLLPWSRRLLEGEGSAQERLGAELAFWRQAWSMVGRLGSRLIQAGYDWVTPGSLGHHFGSRAQGAVDLVRQANSALREELPPGAAFVDIESISGAVGRANYYDMRRYYWTKQPFSETGCVHLAEHLWANVRALTTGPKKVLVVDLDNTLWGGVVGELGPLGIGLGDDPQGEAFLSFQRHLKELAAVGVVLAVASKNNPADAREPFEKNQNMLLALDDVAAFEACWEPKDVMLRRIAETLNLGLDSFVFFDDNPAEREQIRQALPTVAVVDAPEDPSEFVRALEAGLWFERTGLTKDDLARSEQYAAERKREESEQSFATIDDYLRSLEMKADVRSIDEVDLPRVVQLLGKTNQFNLTTRRHSTEAVLELIGQPKSIHLTLRMSDRFGDYGLVSVLIGVPEGPGSDVIRIDTWLMSCRVIGRTAEQFLFGQFLDAAKALDYRQIIGEYIPAAKNDQVKSLYTDLGFQPAGGEGKVARFVVDVTGIHRPKTFVDKLAT